MALTRAQVREILSEAGVDKEHMPEAVSRIIEAHTSTTEALTERATTAENDLKTVKEALAEAEKARDENAKSAKKANAALEKATGDLTAANTRAESAEQERDTLKTALDGLKGAKEELDALKAAGWEAKYNDEHTALEALRSENAAKEAYAAKEKAVRDYYTGKSIVGKELDIAMQGSAATIAALELGDDGKLKDTAALDNLVSGVFAPLVSRIETTPAHNPPASTGTISGASMTLSEAMRAKNENPGLEIDYSQFFPPQT